MSRRARKPRSKSHNFHTPRAGADFIQFATGTVPSPPSVSFWSSEADVTPGNRAVGFPLRLSEPLPFIPSSLPRGQIPRFISPRRLPVGSGRASQSLQIALRRVQTAHRYSTPCEARRTRSRVLHALGIAGRRGVGAGKPRRLGRYSHVRCF